MLADALTSVLAIAGLLAAWAYGWTWLDPVIGVVGALVIARWSWSLIRASGAVLLDAAPNAALEKAIRERLETDDDRIADLHVWRLGPGHHGAIVSLVSDEPRDRRGLQGAAGRHRHSSAMSPSRCIAARARTDGVEEGG